MRRAHAVPNRGQIGADRFFPFLQRQFHQWRRYQRAASVIDPDIKLAESLNRSIAKRLHLALVCNIGPLRNRGSLAKFLVQIMGNLVDLLGPPCCTDNLPASFGKFTGNTLAYPAARAGNHGDIACYAELLCHRGTLLECGVCARCNP